MLTFLLLKNFTVTGGCSGRSSFLHTGKFLLHLDLTFLHYIYNTRTCTCICILYCMHLVLFGSSAVIEGSHIFIYSHHSNICKYIHTYIIHLYNIIHMHFIVYMICLHYCCFWTVSIECSSAQPAIETFVRVHRSGIHCSFPSTIWCKRWVVMSYM